MHRLAIFAISVFISTLLAAQTPPAFDAASVRPNTSGNVSQSGRMAKGSIVMTNMPLRSVLVMAYGVRPERIEGLPSWTDQQRFDITARAAADTPEAELPMMLRTLMAQRFDLIVRIEMREQPVCARRHRSTGP